jgi:hypothetical protein
MLASVATVSPALTGCAAPLAAPLASWPVLSTMGKEFGMAVAAGLFADAVKEVGIRAVDSFTEWTNSKGERYGADDSTEVLAAEPGGEHVMVAARANPIDNTTATPLVVLATRSGHRIDLLPRAGEALARTAHTLAKTYSLKEVRNILVPLRPSQSAGGSAHHQWRSVTWETRSAMVRIVHDPAANQQIVSILGMERDFRYDLSDDTSQLI